jgi:xanthine dehydrogenase accessory factor
MDLGTTKAALALFETGERFALVSTLETNGSSPRHSGAAMLVKTDGSIVGTVGGGALEGRAIRTALEALSAGVSRLMDYELTSADSTGLGMICGGRGRLLIDYIDPAGGAKPDVFAALGDLLAAGGRGWLVTGVTAEGPNGAAAADDNDFRATIGICGIPHIPTVSGSTAAAEGAASGAATAPAPLTVKRCLVDASGAVTGDPPCSLDALQGLAKMGGALDGHTAGDRPGIYVQPVGVPGTAYVFGAGHCGKSLIPLLGVIGFRTVIVDDRADFANAERFPDADSVVVPASFHDVVAALPIDEQSYIVIVTRGHVFDRSVLAQSLRTPAAYVGMIGSKKKVAETFVALREQGFTDQDIARVHAPIGVAIGAETPEEIAVSIAAEIIKVRHTTRPDQAEPASPPPL